MRSVPKFLQSHAHLLGRKQAEEEEEDLKAQRRLPVDEEDDKRLEEVEAQVSALTSEATRVSAPSARL